MDSNCVRGVREYNIPDYLQLVYSGIASSSLPRVSQCANVITEHRSEDVMEAILSPCYILEF